MLGPKTGTQKFFGENMSDPAVTITTDSTDAAEKIRGRIPKAAWGYVRGQYELAEKTYEEIGREFNCTPSAVFYVVKQARDREIPATLERPTDDVLAAARSSEATLDKAKDNFRWASQKVREVTAPRAPSQVEQMAEQATAWLSDEGCKRLFDASSNVIVGFNGFKATPDESGKKLVKDAIHETRRALASLELKIEMMPVNTAAPQSQNQAQRLPELA
jgi:hypothetical protein